MTDRARGTARPTPTGEVDSDPSGNRRVLPVVVAAFLVMGIAGVGLLLWLPRWDQWDQQAVASTDLGTQLVGGSVVAGAILLVQSTWDRRVRAIQQAAERRAQHEAEDRERRFQQEEEARRDRFEAEEARRREAGQRWEERLVVEGARQGQRTTRLLLDILLQLPLRHPGLDLRDIDLDGVRLAGRNLECADLPNAILNGADLQGASLVGGNLALAHLDSARLDDADLRDADLRKAMLTGASLAGADLRGANLTGALVDAQTDFREAKADRHTRWPSKDFRPGTAGVVIG